MKESKNEEVLDGMYEKTREARKKNASSEEKMAKMREILAQK